MSDQPSGKDAKRSLQVDTDLVRQLALMLEETGLTEIEVEDGDRRIRVARGGAPAPVYHTAAVAPAAASPAPAEGGAPAANVNAVKSPMVGTAYLSPEPGVANFVNPGDKISAGDTIMIIEAMKVMNPITAPKAGTLRSLLIDNGAPVEFDQPLFVID